MNLISRKPREKDTREVVFDARPCNHVEVAEEMLLRLRDPLLEPRTESEVMPVETDIIDRGLSDIRPPSATEANRLDQIATLIRSLTYGEMMNLAAALWKMRPEGKEVTEQELPEILHRWSGNK
jgi:hypothetical protein